MNAEKTASADRRDVSFPLNYLTSPLYMVNPAPYGLGPMDVIQEKRQTLTERRDPIQEFADRIAF